MNKEDRLEIVLEMPARYCGPPPLFFKVKKGKVELCAYSFLNNNPTSRSCEIEIPEELSNESYEKIIEQVYNKVEPRYRKYLDYLKDKLKRNGVIEVKDKESSDKWKIRKTLKRI